VRAVLLSDADLASELNSRFVLSWESVRAAPKATIDFGNGKVVTRTLKGNTVFYVCKPNGEVEDILPGVYTPDDFREVLNSNPQELAQLEAEHNAAMLGKFAVESPILDAFDLGEPGLHVSELGVRDISSEPHPASSLVEVAGEEINLDNDSRASVEVLRPAAWRLLKELSPEQKTSPSVMTETVYNKLLGINLQDPYLGLLDSDLPGVE
jgi:hypothetical protein